MWVADIPKYIVAEVSWWPTNPQEVVNSELEKQRKTIIEWMKQDLINGLKLSEEEMKALKFDVVWNIWVVINSKWIVSFFYKYTNWKVEFYTNIKSIQKNEDLPFISSQTWYDLKDWKLSKDWREIPQFTQNWSVKPEFVNSIDTINLFSDMVLILWWMKAIQNWKKLEKFDVWYFELTIIGGLSRIKEVMYFASKWYVPESDFKRLLLRAIQELPNQCSDTRLYKTPKWERMWMEVTKSELDEYLHPTKWEPLITQKMYDDCLKRIEARDRKIKQEETIKKWTRWELDVEWTKVWFNRDVLSTIWVW
jgi:hypothetical protein